MTDATKGFLDEAATGDSYDGMSFTQLNDLIVGSVMDKPRDVPTVHGRRLLVNIQPTAKVVGGQPQPLDPTTVWFKPGAMATALQTATKPAGYSINVGDTLGVKFTGEGEPSQPGFNPPKQYGCVHTPGTNVADAFGGQPPTADAAAYAQHAQQNPAPTPPPQPAPQAPLTAPPAAPAADPFAGM